MFSERALPARVERIIWILLDFVVHSCVPRGRRGSRDMPLNTNIYQYASHAGGGDPGAAPYVFLRFRVLAAARVPVHPKMLPTQLGAATTLSAQVRRQEPNKT